MLLDSYNIGRAHGDLVMCSDNKMNDRGVTLCSSSLKYRMGSECIR